MSKLVSIVIPVHNRAAMVERTLQSIESQTYRPIELVLVNNASTDASRSVCESFAARASRPNFIVRIEDEPRLGASVARNCGLALAQGEWVSFFDSDDIMSPTFISDAMAAAKAAGQQCQIVIGATRVVSSIGGKPRKRVSLRSLNVAEQILTGGLSTQSFVAQSDFIRSIGGWNETLPRWNDWELGIRVLLAHPQAAWLSRRAYHRILAHADSISGHSFAADASLLCKAMQAAWHDLQATNAPSSAFRALLYRQCIVQGMVEREHGNPHLVEAIAEVSQPMGAKWLRHYVAHGGRGAWRIALAMTKGL